jgi:phosphoribosyl-AMP cyclohydrolase
MKLNFEKGNGLVSAIAQDADSGVVLMIAWMNQEAFEETVQTKRAVYYSRSRSRLWRKGEESGHYQEVVEIFVDCDLDAVLLKVRQIGGAACHEGFESCFFRRVEGDGLQIVGEKVFDPASVYKKPYEGREKVFKSELDT